MIKGHGEINKEIQSLLSKKGKILSIIYLCIGAVGLVAYIITSIIFDYPELEYLLFFSVPFAVGLVLLIIINKQIESSSKENAIIEYEFYDTYFMATSFKNSEFSSTSKIYYKDIAKVKIVKSNLFIFPNKLAAFPVDLKLFSDSDLIEIKKLLNVK